MSRFTKTAPAPVAKVEYSPTYWADESGDKGHYLRISFDWRSLSSGRSGTNNIVSCMPPNLARLFMTDPNGDHFLTVMLDFIETYGEEGLIETVRESMDKFCEHYLRSRGLVDDDATETVDVEVEEPTPLEKILACPGFLRLTEGKASELVIAAIQDDFEGCGVDINEYLDGLNEYGRDGDGTTIAHYLAESSFPKDGKYTSLNELPTKLPYEVAAAMWEGVINPKTKVNQTEVKETVAPVSPSIPKRRMEAVEVGIIRKRLGNELGPIWNHASHEGRGVIVSKVCSMMVDDDLTFEQARDVLKSAGSVEAVLAK